MDKYEVLEMELTRLNLAPGEVLSVSIKSDYLPEENMEMLRNHLQAVFPKNQIMVFSLKPNDSISFSAIQPTEPVDEIGCGPGPANYCGDCGCGKKERYESQTEK